MQSNWLQESSTNLTKIISLIIRSRIGKGGRSKDGVSEGWFREIGVEVFINFGLRQRKVVRRLCDRFLGKWSQFGKNKRENIWVVLLVKGI